MKNKCIILGIESSCDETAAAVVEYDQKLGRFSVLSQTIYSQIALHAPYGGVYPEIAARAHSEKILPVINKTLLDAKLSKNEIDAIAVTYGPGLVGSLVIGLTAAKTLAYLWQKPLIGINHLEGHIYSNLISNPVIQFPMLGLIASGGHTLLIQMEKPDSYKLLGQTLDDASGEAFDKVGKLLGLDYPAGPALSKLASKGDSKVYHFNLPINKKNNYNFSFSGLKTAVLYLVKSLGGSERLTQKQKADIARAFEDTVVKSLVKKTVSAANNNKIKTVIIGGGVGANQPLRSNLEKELKYYGINFIKPEISLCTDNAVGIAASGAIKFTHKQFNDRQTLNVNPIAIL